MRPTNSSSGRSVEAEGAAGTGLIAGSEERVLDAGGDDLEPTSRIAVVAAELVGLLVAAHADRVGAVDDLGLGTITPVGFEVAAVGLHPGERVERRDERQVELVLESVADEAAEPVVGVDHIGSVVAGEPVEHPSTELVDHLGQGLLGEVVRTGLDVDHAVAGFDHDLVGQSVTIGASEGGALDAGLGERRHEFAHVHVHAATVAGSRLEERRRVE